MMRCSPGRQCLPVDNGEIVQMGGRLSHLLAGQYLLGVLCLERLRGFLESNQLRGEYLDRLVSLIHCLAYDCNDSTIGTGP